MSKHLYVTYVYSFLKNSSPKCDPFVCSNATIRALTSPPAQNALSPAPSIITNLLEDSHCLKIGRIFRNMDRLKLFNFAGRFKTIKPQSPTYLYENTYSLDIKNMKQS